MPRTCSAARSRLRPALTAAQANLALVLGRMGRPAEALELLDDIFEAEPEELGHWNLKAATLGRLGDFDEAIALYEQVLERSPQQPRVWLSYGHMLKTVGRQADGDRRLPPIHRASSRRWARHGGASPTSRRCGSMPADVAAMEQALRRRRLEDDDRFHLHFALGKAMHDAGRADEAFTHYAEGNALRLEQQPYRPGRNHELRRPLHRDLHCRGLRRAGRGLRGPRPDLHRRHAARRLDAGRADPRRHSLVEGTSELPDIPVLARQGRRLPGRDARPVARRAPVARRGISAAHGVQRRTDRPFFIDKLPNNWLFVPFIQLILPNAKIIDARRHPLACCLSNFRQHFARGQAFTYDLERRRPLLFRLRAADGARGRGAAGPGSPGDLRAPRRRHRGRGPRAARHCGLEFEPACLEFHKTERAVRTASSEQVRRPIYRDATAEWQAYDRRLGPLKDALGPVLDAYPEAPEAFAQR